MTGETNLNALIREMSPIQNVGEYVFCILDSKEIPFGLNPIATFYEQEGMTIVLPKNQADDADLAYSFVSGWITLNVHSALDAIGLTAAVSQALAQAGIACNIVAAYYHDHIFVPLKDTDRALKILRELSRAS